MEGVDGECLYAENIVEQAAFLDADGVRCELPGHVLRVLEQRAHVSFSFAAGGGEAYVLIDFAAQCRCHHLYAATDAEHRDLPMEGFADEEEFCGIALRTDAVEQRQRLFAQEQRVDVAAAREDDAVERVEQGE